MVARMFELKVSVPVPSKSDVYQLGLAVIDPWTKKPAILFANKMTSRNGWVILGNIAVIPEGINR